MVISSKGSHKMNVSNSKGYCSYCFIIFHCLEVVGSSIWSKRSDGLKKRQNLQCSVKYFTCNTYIREITGKSLPTIFAVLGFSHFRFAHSLHEQNIRQSDTFRRLFYDSSNRATAYAKWQRFSVKKLEKHSSSCSRKANQYPGLLVIYQTNIKIYWANSWLPSVTFQQQISFMSHLE